MFLRLFCSILFLYFIQNLSCKSKIEWFNIQSISGSGYQSKIGNRVLLKNKKNKNLQYIYSIGYNPIALKKPFKNYKIDSFTLDTGFEKKINSKQSLGLAIGLNSSYLNNQFKSYYKSKNQDFKRKILPYLSFSTKYKLIDNIRFIEKFRKKKSPLILELEYTLARHISLPSKDPLNHSFINPKAHGFRNFNIGGAIEWDF